MNGLSGIIETAAGIVWGPWTALPILCAGVWLSVSNGFPQLRVGTWWRHTAGTLLHKRSRTDKGVSPFQSAMTALAGTLGTGNIVGVAAAMALGGASAIFWMWIAAALGMGISYAENIQGMRWRTVDSCGNRLGGPMLYMERGLGTRRLALVWAATCALAAFGVGNITQVNAIAEAAGAAFSCPPWLCGVVVAAAAAPAIIGGMKSTVRMTEKLIPIMAGVYIAACAAVIIMNVERVPYALGEIFGGVFRPEAAGGGFLGAMLVGIRRGVFTNEAGLGSAVMLHTAADVEDERTQGYWGMFEVFADTIVMCTITALVILVSGAYEKRGELDGALMSAEAFRGIFGGGADIFIAVCLVLFAFSTVISWGAIGERAFCYIFGARRSIYYRAAYAAVIAVGAVMKSRTVWMAADILNAAMLLPNIAAVTALSFPRAKR